MKFKEPFTTSFGRVIKSGTLEKMAERVQRDHDWQTIIVEELRETDLIPVHEEDMDEAMEVLRYVEGELEAEHWDNEMHRIMAGERPSLD